MKKKLLAGLIGAVLPMSAMAAQDVKPIPPGTPVTITVTQATPAAPSVTITLKDRHGHATPCRVGCVHLGGGNIDVQQPSPDTVVITVTGIAVAYGSPCGAANAGWNIDVEQCFEVNFDNPKVKKAKLTMEGRLIGLLRSHCKGGGTAGVTAATASVACGHSDIIAINLPPHSVACGESLSINDHVGPNTVPVAAGVYSLNQVFTIAACHPKALLPCKAPSAEFAPDPALDPLWISYWEPFHGAAKKDFGFQVIVKVAEDTDTEAKPDEAKPEVKPEVVPPPKEGKPELKP